MQLRQEPCVDKEKYFSLIIRFFISVISYYFQLVLRLKPVKKFQNVVHDEPRVNVNYVHIYIYIYIYILHDKPHCGHLSYMQGASLVSCCTRESTGGTEGYLTARQESPDCLNVD